MFLKAAAECLVILYLTVGIGPTGCRSLAGVNTFPKATGTLYYTGKISTTVSVGGALVGTCAAFQIGVTHQASWADTFKGARHI